MNLIQDHFNLPLSVIFKEDKLDYFKALELSRESSSLDPIHTFLSDQHKKYLEQKIARYKKQQKGGGWGLLF